MAAMRHIGLVKLEFLTANSVRMAKVYIVYNACIVAFCCFSTTIFW